MKLIYISFLLSFCSSLVLAQTSPKKYDASEVMEAGLPQGNSLQIYGQTFKSLGQNPFIHELVQHSGSIFQTESTVKIKLKQKISVPKNEACTIEMQGLLQKAMNKIQASLNQDYGHLPVGKMSELALEITLQNIKDDENLKKSLTLCQYLIEFEAEFGDFEVLMDPATYQPVEEKLRTLSSEYRSHLKSFSVFSNIQELDFIENENDDNFEEKTRVQNENKEGELSFFTTSQELMSQHAESLTPLIENKQLLELMKKESTKVGHEMLDVKISFKEKAGSKNSEKLSCDSEMLESLEKFFQKTNDFLNKQHKNKPLDLRIEFTLKDLNEMLKDDEFKKFLLDCQMLLKVELESDISITIDPATL